MDQNEHTLILKEKLETLFKQGNWNKNDLDKIIVRNDSYEKVQSIWIISDFVKDGKYIDSAIKIADLYKDDPDPSPNSDENEKVKKNEDIRYIVTVRGSLPYLLEKIIATLDTGYYTQVLDIIEKILINESNLYVRSHATLALSSMAINIYAKTRQDGKPFDFDRERVKSLAFKALDKNCSYPRVLEYLVTVFDKIRRLNEVEAIYVLEKFIYKDKNNEIFNPDYVLENVAPLIIYYAEFRKQINDGFNSTKFIDLLKTMLRNGSPRLKATLIWHIWKTIDDNDEYLDKFKVYFDSIFEGPFHSEVVSQLELLIEKLSLKDLDLSIILFCKLAGFFDKRKDDNTTWLLGIQDILPRVAANKPERFIEFLDSLAKIWKQNNVYVGGYSEFFKAYKSAPEKYKNLLRDETLNLFLEINKIKPEVRISYDD